MAAQTLKVTLADTWRPLHLTVAPEETVAQVKARTLAAESVDVARAAEYEVKYGGAVVRDESQTLAAARVPDGAALVVLARRRRAVR